MRARQLVDRALEVHGIALSPPAETDSIVGLLSLARTGHWATIVPRVTLAGETAPSGFTAASLVQPTIAIPIALARLAEEPHSPAASALLDAARVAGAAALLS